MARKLGCLFLVLFLLQAAVYCFFFFVPQARVVLGEQGRATVFAALTYGLPSTCIPGHLLILCLGGAGPGRKAASIASLILASWGAYLAVAATRANWCGEALGIAFNCYTIVFVPLLALLAVTVIVLSVSGRHRPATPSGFCVKCGYNLTGLPEPRCPECGTPFEPAEAGSGGGIENTKRGAG